ncbi:helix-turn-helix transcriptional regulator [Paenibacillus koleovorans]|uniref:helix-turn-helix transcriptional regulator n=1 Tax=Paenibacillus koleovorans TaxID=121608 RepID=UPI000FD9045F|nr:AraC family transcriptional regulator [Paenibacillus koleovorans]
MQYTDIRLQRGYQIEEKIAEYTEHEKHFHDALEISIPLDRRMRYPLPDREYVAEPGDIFLIRPFEPHWNLTLEAGQPARWAMVLFAPAIIGSVARGYTLLTPFYRTDVSPLIPAASPHAAAIQRLALLALEEERTSAPNWEVQHYALLLQILVHVHRYYAELTPDSGTDPVFVSLVGAIDYMIEHWADNFDIDLLIRRTRLRKTGFYTKFKALTGLTPNEFRSRLRLQFASGMLRDTSRAITDIALECGFGSSSYFTKVFKEYRGMSPREFRNLRGT